jgi:octaprenyl-diphosphate synthase
VVDTMKQFGILTGMAFQIKDDLFDFGDGKDIGKPTGIDIKEKKMTLPLIYSLNNSSRSEKRRIINIIKNHNENPEKVAEVIEFVFEKKGIDYAEKIMQQYKNDALHLLKDFKDSEARSSLELLVNYSIERKK